MLTSPSWRSKFSSKVGSQSCFLFWIPNMFCWFWSFMAWTGSPGHQAWLQNPPLKTYVDSMILHLSCSMESQGLEVPLRVSQPRDSLAGFLISLLFPFLLNTAEYATDLSVSICVPSCGEPNKQLAWLFLLCLLWWYPKKNISIHT